MKPKPPAKITPPRPRAESTRYTGNRGPDPAASRTRPGEAESSGRGELRTLRVRRSRLGVSSITTGFVLSSIAIPANLQGETLPGPQAGPTPGSAQLGADLHAALQSFLERLPEGGRLMVEYRIEPTSHGAPRIGVLLLVETRALPEPEALREAQALRAELRIALGTLAAWYAFEDADLGAPGTDFERGRVVGLRPGSFDIGSAGSIGFVKNAAQGTAITVPALILDQGARATLSFAPFWRAALYRTLLAAAPVAIPLGLRLTLQRERLTDEQDAQLRATLRSLQVLEGADGGGSGQAASPTDVQLSAAASFIDAFTARRDYVRVFMHASANTELPEVFLRLAGAEVFPGAPLMIVEQAASPARAARPGRAKPGIDLSTALAYPRWVAPIMPDPWALERLSFARHLENVSVPLQAEGILLGQMMQGGFQQPVTLAEADRSRHIYLLGATGTGKSTLVYNMARQDIEAGRGLAVIDPHGDLFDQLLDSLPASRINDVVIVDPGDVDFPVGLNPLAFAEPPGEHALNRLIGTMMEMLLELHPSLREWAARFEQFFRNGVLLVATTERHPSFESLIRVFSDDDHRSALLARCPLAKVKVFFDMALRTVGENHISNWGPAITSKFSAFVDNPVLAALLCSPRQTIDYRAIMDEGRVLLVNLSKGAIGTLDARMIGMLITDGLFQAALSRYELPRERRRPFDVYLDEFQNFTTRTISDILAEARKYGLRLVLAHQTLGQLIDTRLSPPTRLIDAVLGNVATKLFMRVGLDEARVLEPNFLPRFDARTLAQLPDRRVLCRLLVDNRPSPPFVFSTRPPLPAPAQAAARRHRAAAELHSRQRYALASAAGTGAAGAGGRAPATHTPADGTRLTRPESVCSGATRELQRMLGRLERSAVAPVRGGIFQTFDDSVARVLTIDGDGDARIIILRPGWTNTPPGTLVWIDPRGYPCQCDRVSSLAWALYREVPVVMIDPASGRDVAGGAADAERDALPGEIQRGIEGLKALARASQPGLPGELYLTRNGSLVLVTAAAERGAWVQLVEGGSSGPDNFPGVDGNHRYQVDADGCYVVERFRMAATGQYALTELSGLDLLTPVWFRRTGDGALEELAALTLAPD